MLYVLIAVLAVAILLLFSKIKVFFEYKKHPGEKLYTELHISVGFVSLDRFFAKLQKKTKKKTKSVPKSEEGIVDKLKLYAKTLKTASKIYAANRWHIRKTLVVDKLDFHIKFGFSNAAATGIATGAIWSVLYGLTALVSQVGTLNKHYFEVVPVYTEKGLITQGSIKFSVRVINAISLLVRLYLTYRKVSKTNK